MVRLLLVAFLFHLVPDSFGQELELSHLKTFNAHTHGVRHVVFAPDGSSFTSAGTRGELFLWKMDGEEALRKLEGHFGSITDLRFSEDGRFVVTAGDEGQVKVWNVSTGKCDHTVVVPKNEEGHREIGFALLSPDNNHVYFGGADRSLYRASLGEASPEPEVVHTDQSETVRCAILSQDGSEMILSAGRYLKAVSSADGSLIREYNTGNCPVNALQFSADGEKLLTWCENARVDVRDPETFFLQTSFRAGSGGRKFSNIALTDDGKYVVTGDHASRFNIWNLHAKRKVLDQSADQGTILSFDVISSKRLMLTASLDKSIKLWKIKDKMPEPDKKSKRNKQKAEPEIVEPDVVIIHHEEPVQDVRQDRMTPVNTNVVIRPPTVESVPDSSSIEKPVPVSENLEVVTEELPERKENRRVKPIRQEHRLHLKSRQLTFELWDAQVVDGDIVSIFLGDSCIVNEYSISASRKKVTFDASRYKRVYLYLHAHNLGTIPPNTVTMTVSDGTDTHQVELRSDLSGSAAMELNFVEPVSEDH